MKNVALPADPTVNYTVATGGTASTQPLNSSSTSNFQRSNRALLRRGRTTVVTETKKQKKVTGSEVRGDSDRLAVIS